MDTLAPQAETARSHSPAVGFVTVAGIGVYYLTARFLGDIVGAGKEVHLKASGIGNIVDISESELAGFFDLNPSDYIGPCQYKLEDIDLEEGVMRLVIYSSDGNAKIGTFYGASEGFGEIFTAKKSGTLSAYPSVYQNEFKFIGNSDIQTITFEFASSYIVTKGQPFDGTSVSSIDGNANQIVLDFMSGRELSEACANFYTATVDDEDNHMIHTEGGSHTPKELNFAFNGVLTINGTAFNVCLGQGHHDGSNNWHLASLSMDADNNGKDGDLGSYRLDQDGSHTFKVSLA